MLGDGSGALLGETVKGIGKKTEKEEKQSKLGTVLDTVRLSLIPKVPKGHVGTSRG